MRFLIATDSYLTYYILESNQLRPISYYHIDLFLCLLSQICSEQDWIMHDEVIYWLIISTKYVLRSNWEDTNKIVSNVIKTLKYDGCVRYVYPGTDSQIFSSFLLGRQEPFLDDDKVQLERKYNCHRSLSSELKAFTSPYHQVVL